MTGVSDLPFRGNRQPAWARPMWRPRWWPAPSSARGRPDAVRRAAVGDGLPLMVVQLVGRDPGLMAQGARMAAARRGPDHRPELRLPVQEGHRRRRLGLGPDARAGPGRGPGDRRRRRRRRTCPSPVKMRLGWDDDSRNAADIARRAVDAGVPRRSPSTAAPAASSTRARPTGRPCGAVKHAVGVPVLVNGDIVDGDTARAGPGPVRRRRRDDRPRRLRPSRGSPRPIEAALRGRGLPRAGRRGAPGHRRHPFPPQPGLLRPGRWA